MNSTTLNSLLIDEWHPVKNEDLQPNQVTAGSGRKVWWLGKNCKHEWLASINMRSGNKSRGCPYCAGQKILIGFNDFATKYPNLAMTWHPTKNLPLLPTEVTSGINKKVFWLGSCGHEWETSITTRIKSKGCPVCIGRKIQIGFNDLSTTHPLLTQEWHATKNTSLLPIKVTAGSNKKIWWLGKDCTHTWEARIADRVKGTNCPVCANLQVLIGYNDLSTTHPEILETWHPEKNLPLTPQKITAGSAKKVWWICKENHTWKTSVAHRTLNESDCPYCKGQKIFTGFNDLATVFPLLSLEWHPTKNGNKTPALINKGTPEKAWWICIDGHEWEASIRSRASEQKRGCPICSGHTTLAGFNDLVTLNPELAAEWHPTKNEDLQPNQVTSGSGRKIWWICTKNHEWEAIVADRTYGNGCSRCSNHVSHAEQSIVDFLKENNLHVEQSNRSLIGKELDIYILSHKTAIEFNGLYWHTENQGKDKTYHQAKYLACKILGIQLIQIWEDEWKKNPEQIKAMLLHKLGITQQEKVFARKTIITQLKKAEIEAFLEQHHVQGYAAGSYYLGLKEKSTNELVSVLVLKKEANNTLNIIRYATSKNVVGGFTKLLKYTELTYKPSKFITFSDHCVSDGGLYKNNGFTADKELAPDYRYVVNGERQHKFGYRLKRFRDDPNLQWDENMTERELAALNSLPRIWDAGKTRWIYDCITK